MTVHVGTAGYKYSCMGHLHLEVSNNEGPCLGVLTTRYVFESLSRPPFMEKPQLGLSQRRPPGPWHVSSSDPREVIAPRPPESYELAQLLL